MRQIMERSHGRQEPGITIFGFDIGIASVGWCAGRKPHRCLGVRCFDKAETPRKGILIGAAHGTASRRRLRRRAWRLTACAFAQTNRLNHRYPAACQPPTDSPWHLRVDGIDRRLRDEEWQGLSTTCKHRAFTGSAAPRKRADADAKGKVAWKKGLDDTAAHGRKEP